MRKFLHDTVLLSRVPSPCPEDWYSIRLKQMFLLVSSAHQILFLMSDISSFSES
ncbi:hypothetical protein C4K01_1634 [Pseudomonas synxantha]|nr:hypothetical protein C4K01_1634 [Pseudomonas synxantha]